MNKRMLEFLRKQYPVGTRIELEEMNDPYSPVASGTKGTLEYIDAAGTFQVKWDNGRSLGVIPGEDSFKILPREQTTLKLYMPLTGEITEPDAYGDWDAEPYTIEGSDLVGYEKVIASALKKNRLPEEAERGLMNWYHEQDTVNEKVKLVEFDAEYREGQLWGVAKCEISGKLEEEEIETLKEYITSQAADGFGEGFEQQDIDIMEGILNVHLWNSDNWDIKTEEERFGEPEPGEGIEIEPSF